MDSRIFILATSLLSFSLAQEASQPTVLRYNENTCASMEPVYLEEDYSNLRLGPTKEEADTTTETTTGGNNEPLKTPKRLNSRNPPFRIEVEFDQYRRNREYQIKIVTTDFYEGFMLQVRGPRAEDGNATYVGRWTSSMAVSQIISCNGQMGAAIVSKPRPIRYGNMTFTWMAPNEDKGPIRIYASIIYQDSFIVINSPELKFNTFPVSIKGCGNQMSCFRYCHTRPNCNSNDAEYVVTITSDPDNPDNILFKLGGYIPDSQSYIAIGFGHDNNMFKNMDMVACYRQDNQLFIGHYLVEDGNSQPYLHVDEIALDSSDIDRETGFSWCQFKRPINPVEVSDLNYGQRLFHFYFWGERNDSSMMLPRMDRIISSSSKLNISDVINEVHFTGGGNGQSEIIAQNYVLFTINLLAILYAI